MGMAQPYDGPSTASFGNGFSNTFGTPTYVPAPERARRIVLPRAKVDPSRFRCVVTWSNYMRYCQHDGCNRVMGRNGTSYSYGSAVYDDPSRDVCARCHRKLQRPSLKKWRAKFSASEASRRSS